MHFLILAILFILVDQGTKALAVSRLGIGGSVPIINDFFYLTYVENRGAAFGILQEKQILFSIITVVVIILLLSLLRKSPRLSFSRASLPYWCYTLILGGSIGNFIDRLRLGYVVDFMDFRFGSYGFPVFNVADMCIVVGTVGFLLLLLLEEHRG